MTKTNKLQTIGRDVIKLTTGFCVFVVLWTGGSISQPDSIDDLYTTHAVVTGKDETKQTARLQALF